MMMHGPRILALAAVAAVVAAGPAWAQASAPATKAGPTTYILDRAVTSNRMATARMWAELSDAAQALRADVAEGRWDEAAKGATAVRARLDRFEASPTVDRKARMMVAELRPFVRDLEERIKRQANSALRGADNLLSHLARTQNELLAQGLMERMGGGAGRGAPRLPDVRIYPPGQAPKEGELLTPQAQPAPPAPQQRPETQQPDDVPGRDRNPLDEQRPEED